MPTIAARGAAQAGDFRGGAHANARLPWVWQPPILGVGPLKSLSFQPRAERLGDWVTEENRFIHSGVMPAARVTWRQCSISADQRAVISSAVEGVISKPAA